MDLDQAMHLERDGDGYRVRYAIADVPAFVAAGRRGRPETRRRGQTIYAPDRAPRCTRSRSARMPPACCRARRGRRSSGTCALDGDGEGTGADVYRAMVRSVDRLDYEGVQKAVDAGTADERLLLLKEVGQRRIALERAPWRREPADAGAGGRRGTTGHYRSASGRRAGRGLERPDLADDRDGRGRDDAAGRVGILRTMPAPEASTRRPVPPAGPRAGRRPGPRARRTASSCARSTAPTPSTWP